MAEADRLRLAGRSEADYAGYGYAPLLADDLAAVAAVAGDVAATASAASNSASAAADSAATATTQATAAATSRTQAEAAVASVTVGSTNSLAYPEQVRSLVTAADVVDVFIYDTRLDSDGGAWTERCSGTSWFNETLNTATRGAKRAFPKVALLVLRSGTTNTLGVYDALELDGSGVPRLWRIWAASASGILDGTQRAVTAAQGRILIASSLGLYTLDLAADRALRRDVTDFRAWTGPVSAAGQYSGALASGAIVSSDCNFVHARALPGAPLDPASGLPIPTIAVATVAGTSVIHSNGRVVSATRAGGDVVCAISPDNRLWTGRAAGAVLRSGPLPYATGADNILLPNIYQGVTANGGDLFTQVNSSALAVTENLVALGGAGGLCLIAEDVAATANGMAANIGPPFNSGWMPSSRIQLAALCDGTTGNVTGSGDIVVNGGFTTNMAGWTQSRATLEAVGGVAEVTADGSGAPGLSQVITVVAGQTYTVSVRLERLSGRQVPSLQVSAIGMTPLSLGQTPLGWGTVRVSFTVPVGTTQFTLTMFEGDAGAAAGLSFRADDITCTLVSADRSYRQNGLSVVGTLSRAAVATGADVAAWSGWSASNYLEQPYNAGLDFGTGDFCATLWMQTSGSVDALLARRDPGNTGPQFAISNGGGAPQLPRFTINDGTNNAFVTATTPPSGMGWTHLVAVRRGTTIEIWLNGVLEGSASAASVGSLNSSTAVLRVGGNFFGTGTPASLALVRIAGYAPTPAQIQRMFRDERPLFLPGARAFLGGASTATVRRLSRSRFSNRLAVAMSDGLAVFDGLSRVERHTTATLSPAMASDSVTPVSMESGLLLIGTASNAGVRRDAITGLDRLPSNQPSPAAPRVFRARGVTTDATPLTIAPRIPVGERETVVVWASIVARVYGASDTQSITYERRATYRRDAGGNVTLAGSVQTIGSDVEVTGTADATLAIDTTAQTVAAQVTGIAATRLVWSARFQIERSTHDTTYEEVV